MKNDKKVFILIEAILAVVFLIVAAFMLFDRADDRIQKISVVLQDSDSSQWSALKYGLEMAAADYDAELFVVSTGGSLTVEEEEALLEKEIDNGANGIIVQPVAGEGTEEMLKKIGRKVPVMQVESAVTTDNETSALPVARPDHYEMGAALADELLKDFNGSLEGKTLGIVANSKDTSAFQDKEEGFMDGIAQAGGEVRWTVNDYSGQEEELALPAYPEVDIIIALDDRCLIQAGEAAVNKNLYGAVVYGIGNSMEAFYYLDYGSVECLIVPDEFNVGYESVRGLIQKLQHPFRRVSVRSLSYSVVRKETLFSADNQNILFTMTQ